LDFDTYGSSKRLGSVTVPTISAGIVLGFRLCCLTPLSTILKLYCGGKFY